MLQDLLQKLYTIDHIPTYPAVKNKISHLIAEFDVKDREKAEDLSRHISYDPSLALELLKTANSEAFGFRNKISSIDDALLIMDKDLIKLVIGQHPEVPEVGVYTKNKNEFLRLLKHSVEVQSFLQSILVALPEDIITDPAAKRELVTASVVHDIGLFFMLIYFPDYYYEMIMEIREEKTVQKKQKDKFFPEHSLLSAILCEHWHLPESIIKTVSFHHNPWLADEDCRLGSELLYLADSISNSFYELYYNENDVYSIEEHIVMRQYVLDILEKIQIDAVKIAEIRIYASMITDKFLSDIGL
ncbi:MAG: HDOD domain-containing protein [Spirochaetes bacterium]|nr:HDOD domain-containing protein [Spirochaetota bacterium]